MTVRTAAIVGLNWGLVHLRGLRESGCDVVALAAADEDQAHAVAAREGVPRGTSDVASLNDVDVVVVATPAATHTDVINALPKPFLICEKPILGLRGDRHRLPRSTKGRLLVNYAFGHLATARAVTGVVADLGVPERTELQVDVELPLEFSVQEWFLETASHPLSWLLHLYGNPAVLSRTLSHTSVTIEMLAGEAAPLTARMLLGGEPGIHQRVDLLWASHSLSLAGRYRPGQPWQYDPVLLDGQAITGGESSPTDCWMDANAASVRSMLAVFRGGTSWDAGLANGLFDVDKALQLEAVLQDEPAPRRASGPG